MTAPNVIPITADRLPPGFQRAEDGSIKRAIEDKEGNVEWRWLCSPVRVLALTRDRAGGGWGRLVEITDPDGNRHRWAIPSRMFAGDGIEVRAACLDRGLRLAPGQQARNAFALLLQGWQPRERARTTERLGWADETCSTFTLGDGRVIGAEQVVYQSESTAGAAAAMTVAGSLGDWRLEVAALCIGNPLMLMGVSLAFAGPLLEPLGYDGGGIHLRGASSRGKSTIQRVAASVWGSPALVQTWRATSNGLEGIAAACNSTALILDEMGEIAGREAGQTAYMLANGTGKMRADRTGRARAPVRWCVPILSSGEISLADKMAEAGGRAAAGQAVRLLDIAADSQSAGAFDTLHGARNGAAFADRMRSATATTYGTAGPAFVEKFLQDSDEAKARARDIIQAFHATASRRFGLDGEGQTQRATARLGLIAAAGEMATAWGVTGWQQGAATEAAMRVLGLWLNGRGGAGPSEAREAIERTRAFLVAHGDSRFERLDDGGDNRPSIPNLAGWLHEGTYCIAADAWREIHRGADPQRAARYLQAAGYLEAGDGKNLSRRMGSAVPGRPRAYVVRAEIRGAGDD